ncbi:hypothetical protein MM440_11040 [Arsenicicoccus piscis]|uniref:Uncharacterized protein n=1 Tax=Arsenicicoccus piscis TaxID=673954 RepID=A0ABQ6HJF1_9MICO|nr:hypothetical protein [Arsenicicoccus piscis]MCH8628296.1 hypothetical protein [Arsenicicoccus piscis]GMA18556.1 hypothetical protein GCM10025862_05770 [Arsenicicoccus piscis]
MRWDALFDDLDGQWDAEQRLEREGEVVDRLRREQAALTLDDRLAATHGRRLSVELLGGLRLSGAVVDLGDGWFQLEDAGRALVVTSAVTTLTGLGRGAGPAGGSRRLGLGYALRRVSRDRRSVRMHLVDGQVREGHLGAVGADHVELHEHPVDVSARRRETRAVVVVTHRALAAVLEA